MPSYCLQCRKNAESKASEFIKTKNFYKNMKCVTVKQQNLSKSKKLSDGLNY